eukprot:symbB.v1.2.031033.t1/scaffold3560.1/size54061/2
MASGSAPKEVPHPSQITIPSELRFSSVSEHSEKSRSTRRSAALKEILEMKDPGTQAKLQRRRTSRTSAMETPPTEMSERFPTLDDFVPSVNAFWFIDWASTMLFRLLCFFMPLAVIATDDCVASRDDLQGLMQMQATTKLRSAGVSVPEALSKVEVEFSLIDGAGVHLFDAHPSLLQKRGQRHLGDAKSNALHLKFAAFGHEWNVSFQKRRAPLSRNATLTIGTDDGLQQFHIRDRNVFAT